MEDIKFSSDDIAAIKQIIECHEKEPWTVHIGIRELWLRNNDSSAEFRLLFLFNIRITVSRVTFKNKRTGTMTEVMHYCEQFAKKNHISTVVVQSVETAEMAQWCLKNGYQPNPNASMEFNGLVIGDYEKDIEAELQLDANLNADQNLNES